MSKPSRPNSSRRGPLFALFSTCLFVVGQLLASTAGAQVRAYLPIGNDGTLAVIDDATGTVVATVLVGADPRDVAFAPDGSRVYVSHNGAVSVVDATTLSVSATIPFAVNPFGIDVSPDGHRLYVALYSQDAVAVVDTATLGVETVPVGDRPRAVVAAPNGTRVYVANMGSDDVSVIDTATNTVVHVTSVPETPLVMAIAPDGTRLYLTHMYGNAVSVIDTATNGVVDVLALGTETNGIAVSPDGSLLYVTARGDDELLVVDPSAGAGVNVIGAVAMANGPESVDLTPDGTRIYVASGGDDYVSVIDARTLVEIDRVPVPVDAKTIGGFIQALVPPAPAPPEGVNLSIQPVTPMNYAAEIVASPAVPVALDNTAGALNLSAAIGYSFSPGETRYARFDCPGVVFGGDAQVVYVGDGSASVGALNGLNSSAIYVSIAADDANVDGGDLLTITGGRAITGTESVDCTYGLYDFPSQAAAGGATGRVATASGPYLDFAPGTAFASAALVAVADVEAAPPYSQFVAASATTTDAAALATLEYGPASEVPLTPDGTPVMLSDLHAAGPEGTRIVVTGDFSAAANPDGTFTGDALDRVYLSASNVQCIPGVGADALDSTQAAFAVGATALHRLLCYTPLAGTPVPVAEYSAELAAVPASTAYAPQDIGPFDAGTIERNGTHLQAPLAQVPDGWLSRMVLTNTGGLDRPYVIAVTGETGNLIGTANLTGIVPARGTVVVDLDDVLVSFSGKRRATLNVTVAGPDAQIQGQYQIVNPGKGTLSNHIMVRPGTN